MLVTNTDPARSAVTHTPSDAVDFPPTRGVYVGTSGDLAVKMHDGEQVVFVDVVGGVIHPLRVTQVRLTATTAADILLIY